MEEIYVHEEHAFIAIPKDTVELKLIANIYTNGKIVQIEKTMDMEEVRNAFKEAEDYVPPDALFELTDEGRKYVEELMKNGNA